MGIFTTQRKVAWGRGASDEMPISLSREFLFHSCVYDRVMVKLFSSWLFSSEAQERSGI